jgi:hypothetical protein
MIDASNMLVPAVAPKTPEMATIDECEFNRGEAPKPLTRR